MQLKLLFCTFDSLSVSAPVLVLHFRFTIGFGQKWKKRFRLITTFLAKYYKILGDSNRSAFMLQITFVIGWGVTKSLKWVLTIGFLGKWYVLKINLLSLDHVWLQIKWPLGQLFPFDQNSTSFKLWIWTWSFASCSSTLWVLAPDGQKRSSLSLWRNVLNVIYYSASQFTKSTSRPYTHSR